MMILHLVLCRPGIYLHEIARELEKTLGTEIVLSTIYMYMALKKCGFTWQKLRISALQRDSFLLLQFISKVPLYDHDMMIFRRVVIGATPLESMATAFRGLWLVRNC